MTPTQLATVLFLAFVLVILLPVYRSRRKRGDKPLLSRLMGRQKDEPVPPKTVGRQARNGTKSDLLVTASMVTKAATQNKWFVIMPGFVAVNGEKATLSGIIVTRQGLIAFIRIGEMIALWIKCLPQKHQDLSLIPRTTSDPSTREADTEGSLVLSGQQV